MSRSESYAGILESVPAYHAEANASGVSWAAVIAGGVVSAALAVSLLALGAGLGLSSVSPWSNSGLSAPVMGAAAVIWLFVVQIASAAMGGYLAGRLRIKWPTIHGHEVFFRDTAHGFLVWALALVTTAGFLAAASARMVGEGAQIAAASRSTAPGEDAGGYFVDTLLRSPQPAASQSDNSVRGEVAAIFAHSLRQKQMSDADKNYLAQVVAVRTGLQPADAQQRVNDVFTQAQQAADSARKAMAHFLLWLFIALLSGAFCASYAATLGGSQRDHARTA
jgi:hypothetical protein